jgi:hypothetical protein
MFGPYHNNTKKVYEQCDIFLRRDLSKAASNVSHTPIPTKKNISRSTSVQFGFLVWINRRRKQTMFQTPMSEME